MTLLIPIVVFLFAVWLSAVFSGCETGLYCANRARLHVRAEHGDRRARRIERILRNEQWALSLTLVGTNLSNYAATAGFAFVMSISLGFSDRASEVFTTLAVTMIIFVFGEIVPKTLFQTHADRLLLACSPVLRISHVVLYPAMWAINRVIGALTARFGDQAKTQAGLDARKQVARLLREGMPASPDDDAHHQMVDRALGLADLPVHGVMTPRNRVESLAASAGRDKLLSLARTKPYSLIPVFDRHPRRIEGVIEVRKLLADQTWQTVGERLAPCARLDPHDSVAAALVRLQGERARLAVVVDRGGYLLGVVTLKDLLEELVGELPAW